MKTVIFPLLQNSESDHSFYTFVNKREKKEREREREREKERERAREKAHISSSNTCPFDVCFSIPLQIQA
jgi:hypothetical protein